MSQVEEVVVWVVNAPCENPSQITPQHPNAREIRTPLQTFLDAGWQEKDVVGRIFCGVLHRDGRISDLKPL